MLNQLTMQSATNHRAVIQAQMNKLVKDYQIAKWAVRSAHARRDFARWSEYMRLAKRLKARLHITADWLYLATYGKEPQS